ncbi:3'-5' exonuclease [Erwinia amylovora]|uniref:3'-5' exonuclease n=1 Tax=Erwinia amylovora TaxID=552 RepID=UPI0014442DC7|nr:3'-5' exonuclease [Erwinia amylovora]
MNNLMLDLETMGTKPDAPIVSIGAVFFDPQSSELGEEFYVAVNLTSAIEQGATPDGDTIMWWLKQSAEARAAICTDDTKHIAEALSELSLFISSNSDNPSYLKVWGNGTNFDNVILRSSYERAGQTCPWKFWNDSDVRTIVTLGRKIGFDPKRDMPFDGERHNALADAIHQAKYVSAIWQRLLACHKAISG